MCCAPRESAEIATKENSGPDHLIPYFPIKDSPTENRELGGLVPNFWLFFSAVAAESIDLQLVIVDLESELS